MMEETLCRRYMELRICELKYNNVNYELTFNQNHELTSWRLLTLSVDLGSKSIQSRVFSHVGLTPSQRVEMERVRRVLLVVSKFLGSPVLNLGINAPNEIDEKGSHMHFVWDVPFEELSEALPTSGPLKTRDDGPECKLFKALKAMPDAPKRMDAEGLLLALRQFMDYLHKLCVNQVLRELDSVWFGAAEVSRRIRPTKRWGPNTVNGRYHVSLHSEVDMPSFTELPALADMDLVRMSRGKLELAMLRLAIQDSVTGDKHAVNHGWHLVPTRPRDSREVISALQRQAVRVVAGQSAA